MKKLSLYVILVLIVGIAFYSFKAYEKKSGSIIKNNNLAISNFNLVKKYLEKNYKGDYPVPNGDLILLDKYGKMIHLENRNTPLNKIKNLYVIQGNTCQILKNDKKFNKINYDPRFSIISSKTKKVLFRKCFTYSVTKDRKKFQIGTLVKNNEGNYVAKLDGNMSKPIIKSYDSPILVKNGSITFLPYAPVKLSPVVEIKNLGKSKLTIDVSNNNIDKQIIAKNGVNQLLSGNMNGKYNISIIGNVGNKTQVEFITTNGSIVYIRGDKRTGKVNFALKDYSVDGNKLNYFVETGRFIASIIKLGPDKNMSVNHNGTTLVIRGTKFTIDANQNTFDTFLSLGHIVQKIGNQDISLTMQKGFSLLKNNKLIKDMKKIEQLAGFTVFSNILNQRVGNPKIYGTSTNLTGIIRKRFPILSYNDGQRFYVIKMTKQEFFNKVNKIYESKKSIYSKECNGKNGCIKLMKFKNITNNICSSSNLGKGIDITKLYYILDNNGLKKGSNGKLGYNFKLKTKIVQDLNIKNDTVVFTSREAGVNGSLNTSQRFTYFNNNGRVGTFLLQDFIGYPDLYYKNINNIVILCDNE